MPSLEDAISLAAEAHRGQKDKAKAPYILHPLRVMLRMENDADRTLAVLHDVLEDSDMTVRDLQKAGYPTEIVEAITYLTRLKEEEYDQFIERVKGNSLAVKIKIADLEDNLNFERIKEPNEDDLRRYEKYRRALAKLRKVQHSVAD
jgi:(p)ppGpp synthase/HD superfamily hydrolase